MLSTLHTIDASKTVERIIGTFEAGDQQAIRSRLAASFRFFVSQRLVPKKAGGRVPVLEILKATMRTRDYIERGESEGKSLLDAMRDGEIDGMQDFDTVIRKMIEKEQITLEDGLSFATNQNNLLLHLKGLGSTEDFINAQAKSKSNGATPTAAAPAAPAAKNSFLDMIE